MKALKSEFARTLLADPVTARILRDAVGRAGYGYENAQSMTLAPFNADGTRAKPLRLRVYAVPRAHR